MEKKLQTLLDKLYEEGVAKGQEVASAVVKDAEQKAAKILEEAKQEAAAIRKQAQEEAEETKRNTISELQLSGRQAIGALQQEISQLITTKAVSDPLQTAFSDGTFLKDIINQLVDNWQPSGDGSMDLALLLPPEKEETLYQYFEQKARDLMNKGLQVEVNERLNNGFRIGPADGSYVVSFTEEDFEHFFMDYLRPRAKELLYGKDG